MFARESLELPTAATALFGRAHYRGVGGAGVGRPVGPRLRAAP
jgi:hypothetical protein